MRRIVVKKKALPLDPESLPAPDAPVVFGIDPAVMEEISRVMHMGRGANGG